MNGKALRAGFTGTQGSAGSGRAVPTHGGAQLDASKNLANALPF